MTVHCLYWRKGSELGKGYLEKCRYLHAANKETLWEIAPHLAFVLLFPLRTKWSVYFCTPLKTFENSQTYKNALQICCIMY